MKVRKQLRKRKVRFLSIRQKFMLIAAACILLVSFTIGGISYYTMQEEMLEMAADKAQAIGVLAAGTASAEDIDIAMQLGASHPMGPLHLGDLIGLDICLAIMEVLYNETKDEKYAPQPLLKKMVEEKKLGKKTGIGFFDYSK